MIGDLCCLVHSFLQFCYTLLFRKSTLNAAINGIAFSLNFAMLILGFAVLFGVGAVQVIQDESSVFFTDFTGLFVVFVAFVFGVLVAGQTSTFLPEYLRAKQSANRIFALLNNASNIDSSSDDGRKIVSYLLASLIFNCICHTG